MTIHVRPATPSDLEPLADLMLADAKERHASDPVLWKLDSAPRDKIISTVKAAMEADTPPFRQKWLIAETDGDVVGVTHSILLPVPPIYAGEFGPPGLIMEDCYVSPAATAETQSALTKAAEKDLFDAGAQILLGSSVEGGNWAAEYMRQGYVPLTMYFAKSGLGQATTSADVRKAAEGDVDGIVALSAAHRQIIYDLHSVFWKPHDNADNRFGSWMRRSLTLTDRDMFVSEADGTLQGYAISHPATPLHFPTPHDISGIGVIDDYFHNAINDPTMLGPNASQATALFNAAEAARKQRGNSSVLVVCPAAWASKIEMLTDAGYSNAITWYFKKTG